MTSRPSKKKRERNPEKTREKLLRATLELVAEKGVDALSVKDVASRAGVSRSVAYLRFEDRDHLLKEAACWISEQLQIGINQPADDSSLYERILYTTELVMKNPEASKVMIIDAIAGGGLGLCDPLYKEVAGRLRALKRRGGIDRDLDVEIAAFIHIGSIAATLLYRNRHKEMDGNKLAARFAKTWSNVLLKGMIPA